MGVGYDKGKLYDHFVCLLYVLIGRWLRDDPARVTCGKRQGGFFLVMGFPPK